MRSAAQLAKLCSPLLARTRVPSLVFVIVFTIVFVIPIAPLFAEPSEPHVVRVLYSRSFPPYSFVNRQGLPDGFTVELLKAAAAKEGLQLSFIDGDLREVLQAIRENKADVAASISITPDRRLDLDFTDPIATGFDAIFVRKSEPSITSYDDLTGKSVIVIAESAAEARMKKEGHATLLTAKNNVEAFERLQAGQADAVVVAKNPGLAMIEDLNFDDIEPAAIATVSNSARQYAFGIRKGNAELVTRLNVGLRAVKSDGTFAKIHKKWLAELDPEAQKRAKLLNFLAIGLLVTLVGALSAFMFVFRLRREVQKKTHRLQESEARYRGLVSNMPGVVYRIEKDTDPEVGWRTVYLSKDFELTFGHPPEDFIDKSARLFYEIMHPDDVKNAIDVAEIAKAGASRFEVEHRVFTKDGQTRWISSRGVMVFARSGELVGFDGIFLDITEQKVTAALLTEQQSQMAASARLSSLGEMAGGIAHEINNPLAIINLRTHLLLKLADKGDVKSTEVRAIAEGIEATSHRISKIVKSLQTVARESENDPFEEIQLKTILDDAFELCFQRMMKHGVRVHIESIAEDLRVECRRVQISQVLINLLNNAFDAVVDHPRKFIRVSVECRGEEVEISIVDSGQGIPEANSLRIFQPFFTTKEVGKGTGLGLSISKGLVESHGGRLELDRNSPFTRFVVTLPKRQTVRTNMLGEDDVKSYTLTP